MKLKSLQEIADAVKLSGFYATDNFIDSFDCFQIKKIILADSYSKFENIDNYYLTRSKLLKKTYEFISNYIKKKEIDDFLDKSNFIVNSEDTTNYDLPLKSAGLIIFDEAGVHRGSAPTLEDRVVCRFHYKKS
jgi:hypothetical protein